MLQSISEIPTATTGRPATRITSGEGVDSYPAWSANGERIAFVRSLDGERLAYLERDVVGDIWTLQVDEERF